MGKKRVRQNLLQSNLNNFYRHHLLSGASDVASRTLDIALDPLTYIYKGHSYSPPPAVSSVTVLDELFLV